MARYNLDYVFYSCFATEHKDIKPLNEYDTPGSVKAYEIESGETTEIMKFDIGSNAYVISSSPVVISKNTETKDLRCSTLYTYANGKLSKIMVAKNLIMSQVKGVAIMLFAIIKMEPEYSAQSAITTLLPEKYLLSKTTSMIVTGWEGLLQKFLVTTSFIQKRRMKICIDQRFSCII